MKTGDIQERPNWMSNYTNSDKKIWIYTHTNIGMYEIMMNRNTPKIFVQTEVEREIIWFFDW